jgi:hypothetical protein
MSVLNLVLAKSRAVALGTLVAAAVVLPASAHHGQALPIAAAQPAEASQAGQKPILLAATYVRKVPVSQSGKKVIRPGRNYDKVEGRKVIVKGGKRVPVRG